jgi:hypothetical protein
MIVLQNPTVLISRSLAVFEILKGLGHEIEFKYLDKKG